MHKAEEGRSDQGHSEGVKMSDFDGGIPGPPDRPDCPEFWQLSEIVLGLDASCEQVQNDEEFTSVLTKMLAGRIPVEVIEYTSMQRTAMTLGAINPVALMLLGGPEELHLLLMTTWCDAFTAGMEYQRKYGEVKS